MGVKDMKSDDQDDKDPREEMDERELYLEDARRSLVGAAHDLLRETRPGTQNYTVLRWLLDIYQPDCPYHPGKHNRVSNVCPGPPTEDPDIAF